MIAEHVLGNLHHYDTKGKPVDYVEIDWFETDKKLLRKTTQSGEDIGIKLHAHSTTHCHGGAEHTHMVDAKLQDGDILFEDNDRIIAVKIKEGKLIVAQVFSQAEMGRLCFELGNRHLSLSISEGEVRLAYDAPTFDYLKKLGFQVREELGTLTDVWECKAHAH